MPVLYYTVPLADNLQILPIDGRGGVIYACAMRTSIYCSNTVGREEQDARKEEKLPPPGITDQAHWLFDLPFFYAIIRYGVLFR